MNQIERLKILLPNANEKELQELLIRASDAIKIKRRNNILEERYYSLQIEIAQFLYNKIGAEGEIQHSENNINRTYENAFIPDSMLDTVIPLGKVL